MQQMSQNNNDLSAKEQREIIKRLDKHRFVSCDTGKCFAHFVSKRLRGTDKIVCVVEEQSPDKYLILVIDGKTVTTAPFDDKIAVFLKDGKFGTTLIDNYQYDVSKTRFHIYEQQLIEHFDLILGGKTTFQVDYSDKKSIPAIELRDQIVEIQE